MLIANDFHRFVSILLDFCGNCNLVLGRNAAGPEYRPLHPNFNKVTGLDLESVFSTHRHNGIVDIAISDSRIRMEKSRQKRMENMQFKSIFHIQIPNDFYEY